MAGVDERGDPPPDGVGKCNAHLYLSDDKGENICTIPCQLDVGHEGRHWHEYLREKNRVTFWWDEDEREDRQ